jgi:hypothetical protein
MFSASTGAILRTLSPGGHVFAQPVFGGRYVFVAAGAGGLSA